MASTWGETTTGVLHLPSGQSLTEASAQRSRSSVKSLALSSLRVTQLRLGSVLIVPTNRRIAPGVAEVQGHDTRSGENATWSPVSTSTSTHRPAVRSGVVSERDEFEARTILTFALQAFA